MNCYLFQLYFPYDPFKPVTRMVKAVDDIQAMAKLQSHYPEALMIENITIEDFKKQETE